MFKKYPEIENHYRQKFIDRFFDLYPELQHEFFEITEKLDGANFSIVCHADGSIKFHTRTGIEPDTKFFGWREVFESEEMQTYLAQMKEFSLRFNKTIQFVGELFGKGIQGRVDYGEKKWRWFYIIEHRNNTESRIVPIQEEKNYFFESIIYLRVPTITIRNLENDFNSLLTSLDEKYLKTNSIFTPLEKSDQVNQKEGLVIRPKSRDYFSPVGAIFIVKQKNEKFKENVIKKTKTIKVYSHEYHNLIPLGLSYVSKNRTLSLFSKEGEIDSPKEIGKYIKLYSADVFNDFLKLDEYQEKYDALSKEEQKVFNKAINKEIVQELNSHL